MAETHVLTALYRKYALVMGEVRKAQQQAEKHHADLEHIEAVIRLFNPNWTNDGIKPRKAHKPSRWSKRGAGMQTGLEVLRDATEPLTTRQIVVQSLERQKLPEPHYDDLKRIMASFNSALTNRAGRGVILHDGHPKRWSIDR
jgi:hypothetical protein